MSWAYIEEHKQFFRKLHERLALTSSIHCEKSHQKMVKIYIPHGASQIVELWAAKYSRYLIMDRDAKYTDDFRDSLDREGVKPVRCPVRALNCNAFAERFVRSIKDECLDRMMLFGAASLRRALREYVAHILLIIAVDSIREESKRRSITSASPNPLPAPQSGPGKDVFHI